MSMKCVLSLGSANKCPQPLLPVAVNTFQTNYEYFIFMMIWSIVLSVCQRYWQEAKWTHEPNHCCEVFVFVFPLLKEHCDLGRSKSWWNLWLSIQNNGPRCHCKTCPLRMRLNALKTKDHQILTILLPLQMGYVAGLISTVCKSKGFLSFRIQTCF